ncbi:MAG TPA: ATP-binding protein [Kofleriaceae bacterium]|nr:ATP-binding protein [Kofleriaceae bacterium]
MIAPIKFRHRIGILVALAAAALVAVTAVTLVLGRSVGQQLAGIETLYVPLVELDRDLKALFNDLPRALQDAADAAEISGLSKADEVFDTLVHRLRAGWPVIAGNGENPVALEAELRVYYGHARGVATALIAGTPGSELTAKIEEMTRARQTLSDHLDLATKPDRGRLGAAFASARSSQQQALWLDIAVALCALLVIGVLSWRLIRRTVTTLRAVTLGVERLARGDAAHEIEVMSRDELGDLAREANQTAVRLREYRTQVEVAQQLLEDRNAELARASRYKSEFLASMSHELRTPLNSIMILSAVLAENRDATMTAKQIEFATLINRSGEELLGLINEVLDLSKIEAGKQEMQYETMKVADLLDYIRRMFRPLAIQKGLAFEVVTAGGLPAALHTDRVRLAQIVKNMIANALKFTERGGVTVRVSRGAPRPASGEAPAIADPITIAVADTGIGIAPEQQAWIFEAFAQGEVGISRKFGGTGLGLTIAKGLAVRLGGDLTVESALGAGSTFTVILPIGGPGDDAAPPRPLSSTTLAPPIADGRARGHDTSSVIAERAGDPPAEAGSLDGKTVMIVDDDMRSLYQLSSALRGKHLQVITAADGQEALDELGRHPGVDFVLVDAMTSGVDGHEATQRIRGVERFRDLPIIPLTKPVDVGHLLGVMRGWLA